MAGNVNSLLSPQQQTFVSNFAKVTNLDPNVVGAWVRNEEPNQATNTDPVGHGKYNFLNIGITGSKNYGNTASYWNDPGQAGTAAGKWALGQLAIPGFGHSSSGIQGIFKSAGQTPQQQIAAIQGSGWAAGGEKALASLYSQFSGVKIPAAQQQMNLANNVVPKGSVTPSNASGSSQQGNTFLDFLTAKMGAQQQNAQQGVRVPIPSLTSFLNQVPNSSTGSGTLLGLIQKGEAGQAPTPVTVKAAPGTKATGTTAAAIDLAKQYLGTPYVFGGADPKTGFDCSGLVQYTFGKQGIQVPRTSEEQWKAGKPVTKENMQPGDVVFFAGSDGTMSNPGHEGIYLGNDQFIEAPHTGDVVKIAKLSTRSDFSGARSFS